jgi:hypothetical protein
MNARPKKLHRQGGENRIADHKAKGKKPARGKTTPKLRVAITGKASPAKAAEGNEPVFAYIASLPQPQRAIAERTEMKPEPPVTPIGMGKATRGVEPASVDDLDERQAASWMKQAAAMPFFGGKKR